MKLTSRVFTPLLFLHIYVTGFAVFIFLYVLIRQFSLILGRHMAGIGILATAVLLVIAVGGNSLGKRADRSGNLTGLLIILELGIAIYAFCTPLLQILFIKMTGLVSQHMNPGTFGTSLLWFLFSFILFFPAAMIGGLIPVYSKFTIRHVSHIGKKTGIIFALLNAGALTGCCLAGLFLIPEYGHSRSLIIAASVLVLNSLLTFVFFLYGAPKPGVQVSWPLAQKVRKSGLFVLKKKAVLEAEPKLTRTLLWVFTIQGFTAMAYIILWTRILLSLSSISNIRVMAGILLLTLTGTALGSILLKGVADRPRKRFYMMGLIEMLIGVSAIVSYIAMFLLMDRFNHDPAEAAGWWTGFRSELILMAIFMLLPTFFTGATFPMACRLYPKRFKKVGQRIGWLGNIFILGAIMSLFMISFIFIPMIGVNITFFIIVIISILIGVVLFLRDSRFKRGFRMAVFLLAIVIIMALQHMFRQQSHQVYKSELFEQDSIQVIKEGSTASVMLIARTQGRRDLLVNGELLLQADRKNLKVQQMLGFLPYVFGGRTGSAYLVGFGLGVTAMTLENCGIESIHITDIAPEVVSVTSASFADLNDDILTKAAVTIEINDSRSFLRQNSNPWDLITFSHSDPELKPDQYTLEFYRLCSDKLEEDGAFCQVIPVSEMESETFRKILKSCCSIFPEVTLWYGSPERMLLLASKNLQNRDFCELDLRYSQLNRDDLLSRTGFTSLESLLGCLLLDPVQIREYVSLSGTFTDDQPLWELNKPVNAGINIEILQNLRDLKPGYRQLIDFTGTCVTVEEYTLNIIDSYRKIIMAEIANVISRGTLDGE